MRRSGVERGRTATWLPGTGVARWVLTIGVGLLLVGACASAGGDEDGTAGVGADTTSTSAPGDPSVIADDDPMNQDPVAPGAERLRFQYGPVTVEPGQNNIEFSDGEIPKPDVPGWIVRISPNLHRTDGTVPPVDVIHLHHGVWLNTSRQDPTSPRLPERIFAAGEEKTIQRSPEGFGYRYDPNDSWTINYMIHNLFPTTEEILITYDIDFVPADAPQAADIREARPIWMDVVNGSIYPVFDVIKGQGGPDGELTYPTDVDAYGGGPARNEWAVDREGVLIGTGGHLHPGGLHTDLYVRRPGASAAPGTPAAQFVEGDTARLFRSEAIYYEPAGAVSWDVSMTVTPLDWRVAVRPGDVLSMTTTYDTERASWYESMGIMVVWMADGTDGDDPFQTPVAVDGEVTHGHLPENDNHGGEDAGLPDAADLPSGRQVDRIGIADFLYEHGDTSDGATDIPTVPAGDTITFDNTVDAPLANGIWHTITSCRAPCNGSTGIAYPLADADIQFDSGQLGEAGPPTADRLTWDTPADLPAGTYTYFCRVHPFMRGAFRVTEPG